MKKFNKFSWLFSSTLLISLCHCKKDVETANLQPSPSATKNIKARILEYGTDLPIAGATVRLITCSMQQQYESCSGTDSVFTTNANGECIISGNFLRKINVYKDGYWAFHDRDAMFTDLPALSEIFPANIPISRNAAEYANDPTTISCDSLVIKLVPQTFITIHIRDSSGSRSVSPNFYKPYLQILGNFYSQGNAQKYRREEDYISIVPIKDTTFQFPVFGNSENSFEAGFISASNPVDDAYSLYHVDTVIYKGSHFILNINY